MRTSLRQCRALSPTKRQASNAGVWSTTSNLMRLSTNSSVSQWNKKSCGSLKGSSGRGPRLRMFCILPALTRHSNPRLLSTVVTEGLSIQSTLPSSVRATRSFQNTLPSSQVLTRPTQIPPSWLLVSRQDVVYTAEHWPQLYQYLAWMTELGTGWRADR